MEQEIEEEQPAIAFAPQHQGHLQDTVDELLQLNGNDGAGDVELGVVVEPQQEVESQAVCLLLRERPLRLCNQALCLLLREHPLRRCNQIHCLGRQLLLAWALLILDEEVPNSIRITFRPYWKVSCKHGMIMLRMAIWCCSTFTLNPLVP